tara:strand:+ start:891 stop:1070 length:180 start_codon:yes stop_codon:yes gene_type:complete
VPKNDIKIILYLKESLKDLPFLIVLKIEKDKYQFLHKNYYVNKYFEIYLEKLIDLKKMI